MATRVWRAGAERLALLLALWLTALAPLQASDAYEQRVTVDEPCRIAYRLHGSGDYRPVGNALVRQAALPVEFDRSYDVRAEGPSDWFHRWVGEKIDFRTNTPSTVIVMKTDRVIDWMHVFIVLGGVTAAMGGVAAAAVRRSRQAVRRLDLTLVALTEAEARSGLFPADGSLPERIGTYEVVSRLGAGGMAVVYRVRDGAGEELALKLPLPNLLENEEFRTRFSRELKVGMRLTHPNLVHIVDVNAADESAFPYPYLVMELVAGRPLDERLQKGPPFEVHEALDMAEQLLDALAHVHRQGIIHRDVKPSNIMLTRGGRPKLMDFGVAHRQETSGARLTATDEMLGTPLYMAPEQIKGRAVDARADVYAVGMVLYEMLARRVPFSEDPIQTIIEKLTRECPPLSEARPDLPTEVAACVMRMVAAEADARFASAAEARDAVRVLMETPA